MRKRYTTDGMHEALQTCQYEPFPLSTSLSYPSFLHVLIVLPGFFSFSFIFGFFVFSLRWSGTVLLSLSRIVLSQEKLISAASNVAIAECMCVCGPDLLISSFHAV